LRRLLDETRVKKLVLDHHAVRQLEYRSKLTSVWEDERVMTAAEYLGQDNNLLEARRQELWKDKFMEGSELVPTDPPADI
jgi:predicted metallo-beta-lactamase superfamily hydrolase